jgi:hypothetical protein
MPTKREQNASYLLRYVRERNGVIHRKSDDEDMRAWVG